MGRARVEVEGPERGRAGRLWVFRAACWQGLALFLEGRGAENPFVGL